ncbi:MAG: hypothetical protein JSW54_06445 [Fidelibacterota bacterium]|nr:MAG: hypothetical protein JSW54_06445 [Candidatus Neomarinimicrobiota bacterium]
MKTWALRVFGLGAVMCIVACPPPIPRLEEALYLYREGQINEARRDMVAYIRAKPFNPEVEEARQHIILIRRIKQLESIAVEQWRRGNAQGAVKVIGVMKILHPVYVDSTEIFQLVDFSQPPKWVIAPPALPKPTHIDTSNTIVRRLIPYALRFLDRQQEAVAYLSRQWELIKYHQLDNPIQDLALQLSMPQAAELLRAMQVAREELHEATPQPNPLTMRLDLLNEQFDQFLSYIRSDSLPQLLSFEYGFHGYKRDLILEILSLRAQLISAPEIPDSAVSAIADSTS